MMNNTNLILRLRQTFDVNDINKEIASNILQVEHNKLEIEDGYYLCKISSIKLKRTKTEKLMFTVTYNVVSKENSIENKFAGRTIYFNRVIVGNRTTEKWNDGRALQTILDYLYKLGYCLTFNGYEELNNDLTTIYEELKNKQVLVCYRADAFTNAEIVGIRTETGETLQYNKE